MYEKFPVTNYFSSNGYGPQVDITTALKVADIAIREGEQPINLPISETDRPEVFADRVYQNSNMHWLSLHLNKKVNPYYEWILSPSSFENYMEEKYPGYTLFLTSTDGTKGFTGSFRVNNIVFATDQTNPELQPSIQSSLKNSRVVRYDPLYCRLVIELVQRTAWIPVEGDYIAGSNADALGNTYYYVARIGKVIESQYALHHFEDDGVMLDPLLPLSKQTGYISSDALSGHTFGDTLLGRYINEDYTTYSVTNREYEDAENDNNRNILVLNRAAADRIKKQIEESLTNDR
jgi:Base plate wedge protein 53